MRYGLFGVTSGRAERGRGRRDSSRLSSASAATPCLSPTTVSSADATFRRLVASSRRRPSEVAMFVSTTRWRSSEVSAIAGRLPLGLDDDLRRVCIRLATLVRGIAIRLGTDVCTRGFSLLEDLLRRGTHRLGLLPRPTPDLRRRLLRLFPHTGRLALGVAAELGRRCLRRSEHARDVLADNGEILLRRRAFGPCRGGLLVRSSGPPGSSSCSRRPCGRKNSRT